MHERLHTWISAHTSDALTMLERLVGMNTWSWNPAGLAASADALAEAFSPLGEVTIEPIGDIVRLTDEGTSQEAPLGPAVRVRAEGPGAHVMLIGHHDTVFAPDVPFAWADEGSRITGPGVVDAKGGLAQVWLALGALAAEGIERSWELLVVPDEEIGSVGSAPVIRETASRADIGLGFEPSFPDGTLAAARAGSANYSFLVLGRSAHAGREHHLGRNAVAAAARLVLGLEAMTDRPRILCNPAVLHGGRAPNIVPDTAVVRANVRAVDGDAADEVEARIAALCQEVGAEDGIDVELHGGFTRPPKPRNPGYTALLDGIVDRAGELGIGVAYADTGGVCDGNLMADAGLHNVDNLGPVGGNLHQVGEYLERDSLGPRALLAAALIADPPGSSTP
ncbi:MAG: M20/M25/M40 family metallo-hydrolase [Acidimicrobiia bacterium]|nr:M20/M25/M40 family metallo-hydrolase [Acidimicrobiia bacterium]